MGDTNNEELFTSFDQSLKTVVKHTARCAVTSLEDNASDGKVRKVWATELTRKELYPAKQGNKELFSHFNGRFKEISKLSQQILEVFHVAN